MMTEFFKAKIVKIEEGDISGWLIEKMQCNK